MIDKTTESNTTKAVAGRVNALVRLPDELTAENGAKYLLLGEFKVQVENDCWDCHGIDEGEPETCHTCGGSGVVLDNYDIEWTTIKEIYAKIVKNMAVKFDPLNDVNSVIEEFTGNIPKHINDMPSISSNGVTRNEMEWKHIAKSMAKEINLLRHKAI